MVDTIEVRYIQPKHWLLDPNWELLKPYTSANGHIIVPAGFIAGGANLPRYFRKYFSSIDRYFGAFIILDYILSSKDDKEIWERATSEFKSELKALGIHKWRIFILDIMIKIYGKIITMRALKFLRLFIYR